MPLCRLIYPLRRTVDFEPCKVVYTADSLVKIGQLSQPLCKKHQLVRIGIAARVATVKGLNVLDGLSARIVAHTFQKQGKIALL